MGDGRGGMGRGEARGRRVRVWGKERRARGGRGARKKKRKETISIKFDIASPPPRISKPVSPYLVSPPPATQILNTEWNA